MKRMKKKRKENEETRYKEKERKRREDQRRGKAAHILVCTRKGISVTTEFTDNWLASFGLRYTSCLRRLIRLA